VPVVVLVLVPGDAAMEQHRRGVWTASSQRHHPTLERGWGVMYLYIDPPQAAGAGEAAGAAAAQERADDCVVRRRLVVHGSVVYSGIRHKVFRATSK
jgi:hypothetical protein